MVVLLSMLLILPACQRDEAEIRRWVESFMMQKVPFSFIMRCTSKVEDRLLPTTEQLTCHMVMQEQRMQRLLALHHHFWWCVQLELDCVSPCQLNIPSINCPFRDPLYL